MTCSGCNYFFRRNIVEGKLKGLKCKTGTDNCDTTKPETGRICPKCRFNSQSRIIVLNHYDIVKNYTRIKISVHQR